MQDAACSIELLPPLLQDIVRLIALQPTMALVAALGGVRVYIPTEERATADHALAGIVGYDNLRKLAREYGGQSHFQLPKATHALKALRNAEIARAYSQNKTARELALMHGLTEGQVVRIVAKEGVTAPADRRQQRLF